EPAGQGVPSLHWAIGGMHRPSVSEQHWSIWHEKVGGQMSPDGPQPSGGGTHRLMRSTQHWPSMHCAIDGHAAPVPHPCIMFGTHWPMRHCEPGGQGSSAVQPCAT